MLKQHPTHQTDQMVFSFISPFCRFHAVSDVEPMEYQLFFAQNSAFDTNLQAGGRFQIPHWNEYRSHFFSKRDDQVIEWVIEIRRYNGTEWTKASTHDIMF